MLRWARRNLSLFSFFCVLHPPFCIDFAFFYRFLRAPKTRKSHFRNATYERAEPAGLGSGHSATGRRLPKRQGLGTWDWRWNEDQSDHCMEARLAGSSRRARAPVHTCPAAAHGRPRPDRMSGPCASAARGRPQMVRIPLGSDTGDSTHAPALRRVLRHVKTKLVMYPQIPSPDSRGRIHEPRRQLHRLRPHPSSRDCPAELLGTVENGTQPVLHQQRHLAARI
jgi:hypothetical protein